MVTLLRPVADSSMSEQQQPNTDAQNSKKGIT